MLISPNLKMALKEEGHLEGLPGEEIFKFNLP